LSLRLSGLSTLRAHRLIVLLVTLRCRRSFTRWSLLLLWLLRRLRPRHRRLLSSLHRGALLLNRCALHRRRRRLVRNRIVKKVERIDLCWRNRLRPLRDWLVKRWIVKNVETKILWIVKNTLRCGSRSDRLLNWR
jgi:hypothetical protein